MYEYSLFVDIVRKYKTYDPVNGFKKAIGYCIQHRASFKNSVRFLEDAASAKLITGIFDK